MNFNNNFSLDIKISNICSNEYDYFLDKRGVVGVALGYKIIRGFCTFKKCITVFVTKKLSNDKLSIQNIIPKCFKGIITDVIESGNLTFHSLKTRVRPVINGYSIGNILKDNSETCGCLVSDKYLYILSCNHILALNNTAPIESVILQPGVFDGGDIKKDVIGHLQRFIPINFIQGTTRPENFVDCALCKVISRSFVSSSIAFVGIPKGTSKTSLGDTVKKVGRTTELTYGLVTNLCAILEITAMSIQKKALFKDQIITTKMDEEGDLMKFKSLILDKTICSICDNKFMFFLSKKHVVGIGFGYKITKGFLTNEKCITVFVTNKLHQNKLNKNDVIPICYKGVKTDVIQSGAFLTQGFTDKVRPTLGGYSIGNEFIRLGGTLGGLVEDKTNTYILSCNHVLVNNDDIKIGTKVLQPSIKDKGNPSTDAIAIVSKYIKLKPYSFLYRPSNYVDCAIAKVIDPSIVSNKIALIGNVKGTNIARFKMKVQKVGKTSELTSGTITNTNCSILVDNKSIGKSYLYKNQIIATHMLDPGDSGSLILDENNFAIGLGMSSSDSTTQINPINAVLDTLKVKLVTS